MQPPRYSAEHRELEFDADEWISGLQLTGLDPAPYIDAWQRLGTAATMGHVAAYLDSNPYLLTCGTSGPGASVGTPAGRFAEQVRTWLSACIDDPTSSNNSPRGTRRESRTFEQDSVGVAQFTTRRHLMRAEIHNRRS